MSRRSGRSRKGAGKRRRSRQTLIGAVIIAVVLLVVAGVLALRFSLERERIPVDANSMCPTDGPFAYTSILIDGTDTFSAIQIADLRRYFGQLKDNVQQHEQIAVYAPREMTSASLLQPLLKICNPGDADGVSGFTANPESIQRRYDRFP